MSCEKSSALKDCQSGDRVAVLIGFQSSLHRNFCNACVRQASVMKQYTGNLLGHCETVESIEGCWPKNYGLGVLIFEQGRECAKWTTSDPVFRAQDFLEQVEMYCVPLCNSIPTDYPVLSIIDLDVREGAGPSNDTLGSHAECVRAAGGFPCVAATGRVHKFHAWYTSEAGAAEREKRQQVANADIILACLTREI
uniref:CMP/dCMP-type deaminase domain-containing protein n=1 Tax=Macrostomum lignano TaxID=282301 RepID=A0A1I8GL30_9PLAT